jgi:D-alanyl-D-alanine carboxypeptidase (penicillin-binding protein 5/6)
METIPTKQKFKPWFWIVLVVFLIVIYSFWATNISLPLVKPTMLSNSLSYEAESKLAWPGYGQSAVGIDNLGVTATNGTQTPLPIASTAKVIAALAILSKKPLSLGSQGPTITLNQSDVDIYNNYVAEDGSVTKVVVGEQISEYQMLQTILLPSADNMADSLAIWAFGSLSAYSAYANQFVASSGLANTHVGVDASGFDPSTTSTASDLVKLGELAVQNPVIAQIVDQSSANNIPIVGTISNVDSLIGSDNIVGIKTGNTDQAGGVFLSASRVTINKQPVSIITAVMQAPSLWQALNSSDLLVESAQDNFSTPQSLITSSKIAGKYIAPWSKQVVYAETSQSPSIETAGGTKVTAEVHLKSISFNEKAGQVVGNISYNSDLPKAVDITNLVTNKSLPKPSKWWLILHPNKTL